MKYFVFLKKELKEIFKTYKIYVLPAVFLFFGFLSPVLTKFTPELLKSLSISNGINVTMTELPKFSDAYAQFFKNLNQIGIIVLILVFMGMVVDEKVKGSAAMVLTKSLSRTQFILSKFIASAILFTCSYVIGALGCIYYTFVLFPTYYHKYLILAFLLFWVYGLLIISITVFASTISKSHMMSAVIGFIGFILASASAMFPYVDKYTPGMLCVLSTTLLSGGNLISDVTIPLIVTILFTIVFLWGSVELFKRQEL